MKLNFGRKLILFMHWLFALLISIAAVLYYVAPDIVNGGNEWLVQRIGRNETMVVLAIFFAIYVVFMVATAMLIFKRHGKKNDKGYIIIDNGDKGRSRIALSAIDQMVRQSIRSIEGVTELKTNVIGQQEAVTINAAVTIQNGAHIPTITMNVQNSIRSYIELNCGVAVREVCVSVNSMDANSLAKPMGTYKTEEKEIVKPEPSVIKPADTCATSETVISDEQKQDEYYIPGEGKEIKLTLGDDE